MNDDAIQLISVEEAAAMLPDNEYVHTFRQAGGVLLGADWDKAQLLEAFASAIPNTLQLSGPTATRMGHCICFADKHGYVFVETKSEGSK